MNLDSINEIVRLRDQRSRAEQVITLMRMGESAHFTVMHKGTVHETFDLLSPQLLRGAVAMVAMQEVEQIEDRLRKLGVSMPAKEPEPAQTVEALNKELTATRRELDMYRNAWLRELGGRTAPKRHLIDALCVTTAEMRETALKYSPGSVPAAEHSARVTALLEFNNKLEQRARNAERKLRTFMDGSPADRLAFAIEQAAASTIAAIKSEPA